MKPLRREGVWVDGAMGSEEKDKGNVRRAWWAMEEDKTWHDGYVLLLVRTVLLTVQINKQLIEVLQMGQDDAPARAADLVGRWPTNARGRVWAADVTDRSIQAHGWSKRNNACQGSTSRAYSTTPYGWRRRQES